VRNDGGDYGGDEDDGRKRRESLSQMRATKRGERGYARLRGERAVQWRKRTKASARTKTSFSREKFPHHETVSQCEKVKS